MTPQLIILISFHLQLENELKLINIMIHQGCSQEQQNSHILLICLNTRVLMSLNQVRKKNLK